MARPVTATVVRYQSEVVLPMRDAELIYVHTARLTFDLAFENIIQAAAIAHPAFIKSEDFDVRHSKTSSYAC